MYEYYFTFRSMTQAQRAAGLLQQRGIRATPRRTPRAVSRGGCGNAVAVGAADVYRAAGMLRGALVLFDKCYRVSPQGGAEEVFP